jgi:hypothetical protein
MFSHSIAKAPEGKSEVLQLSSGSTREAAQSGAHGRLSSRVAERWTIAAMTPAGLPAPHNGPRHLLVLASFWPSPSLRSVGLRHSILDDPWSIDDARSGHARGLLKGIVRFRTYFSKGSGKVSQNRPTAYHKYFLKRSQGHRTK